VCALLSLSISISFIGVLIHLISIPILLDNYVIINSKSDTTQKYGYSYTLNYSTLRPLSPLNSFILPTNWSPLQGNSCLFSKPFTKTSNENQLENSFSASTLRTRRRMYPKKRPTEVTRSKKAAKKSNKPKGSQIEEESLKEYV